MREVVAELQPSCPEEVGIVVAGRNRQGEHKLAEVGGDLACISQIRLSRFPRRQSWGPENLQRLENCHQVGQQSLWRRKLSSRNSHAPCRACRWSHWKMQGTTCAELDTFGIPG